jgi:hypothetical protein
VKQDIRTYSPAQLTVSNTAFWDVDFTALDVETDSQFVINKVFNYGLWADMVVIMKYYGLGRIRQEVVRSAYWKKTALSFLCLILDLNETDFTAYQRRQERSSVWTY